jgi:hypothetical protein
VLLLLALLGAVAIGLRLLDSPRDLVCRRPFGRLGARDEIRALRGLRAACHWRRGTPLDDLTSDDRLRRRSHTGANDVLAIDSNPAIAIALCRRKSGTRH